ncbi:hypothetical protein TNCT_576871, partial [Trichonephila clavata]
MYNRRHIPYRPDLLHTSILHRVVTNTIFPVVEKSMDL